MVPMNVTARRAGAFSSSTPAKITTSGAEKSTMPGKRNIASAKALATLGFSATALSAQKMPRVLRRPERAPGTEAEALLVAGEERCLPRKRDAVVRLEVGDEGEAQIAPVSRSGVIFRGT